MSARALYARRICGAAAGATLGFLSGRSACAEVQQQPKTAFGGAFAQPTFAESAIAQAKGRKLQSFTTVAQAPTQMVIISPSFYPSVDDVRCQLGLQAVRKAKSLGIPILLVDASPAPVRAALEEAGAVVRPQTRAGKKGAALRECVESALEQFQLTPDGVICYQELEKVEMIPLQAEVAAFMMRSGTDVCVPKREDGLFRATYPVEQYHSEHFANLHLDALGRPVGLPALDWTFGPVAFRASMARHWLQCEGELWDAQLVPIVHASRWHGARVETFEVGYAHPPLMRREEEGIPAWSEKRLLQLNFLFDKVGGALKAAEPP